MIRTVFQIWLQFGQFFVTYLETQAMRLLRRKTTRSFWFFMANSYTCSGMNVHQIRMDHQTVKLLPLLFESPAFFFPLATSGFTEGMSRPPSQISDPKVTAALINKTDNQLKRLHDVGSCLHWISSLWPWRLNCWNTEDIQSFVKVSWNTHELRRKERTAEPTAVYHWMFNNIVASFVLAAAGEYADKGFCSDRYVGEADAAIRQIGYNFVRFALKWWLPTNWTTRKVRFA